MTNEDDEELLALLQGDMKREEKLIQERVFIPSTLPITRNTLEKAYEICRAVHTIDGKANEWFSFLLAQKNDPCYVVRDLLLVKGTHAGHAYVAVSGENHARANLEVVKLNEELDRDYYIIGWLHSHADFQPNHSQTDNENFEQLLNTLYLNTQQRERIPLNIVESAPSWELKEGKIRITGQDTVDGYLEYTIPNPERLEQLLEQYGFGKKNGFSFGKKRASEEEVQRLWREVVELCDLKTYEPLIRGFGYSIVVNEKKDTPYAEIGIVEEKGITGIGKKTIIRQTISLEVVDVEDDVEFTTQAMQELVRERIVFPPKYVAKFPSGNGKRNKRWFQRDLDEDVGISNGLGFQAGREMASSQSLLDGYEKYQKSNSSYFMSHTNKFVKKEQPSLRPEELVNLFVYAAAGYVSRYRSQEVFYSGYMNDLLGVLGRSQQGISLRQAIYQIGPLESDGEEVEVPTLVDRNEDYILGKARENIRKTLEGNKEDIQVSFLWNFLAHDQNEAMEKFIPELYDEVHRDRTKF